MRQMLSRDLPTDVPPYFWTTQGTSADEELRTSSSGVEDVGVESVLKDTMMCGCLENLKVIELEKCC